MKNFHPSGLFLALICLPVLLGLAGCAGLQSKKDLEKKEASSILGDEPVKLGTVAAYNEMYRFTLIDTGIFAAPPKGTRAVVVREGVVTCVLSFTEERRSPFVLADVTEGIPEVGDEAFLVVETNIVRKPD